jgi:hypothetical protein
VVTTRVAGNEEAGGSGNDGGGGSERAPVYATLIYHILVPAHGPDICTAVTAHHPNFSHLLYAARDAGGG